MSRWANPIFCLTMSPRRQGIRSSQAKLHMKLHWSKVLAHILMIYRGRWWNFSSAKSGLIKRRGYCIKSERELIGFKNLLVPRIQWWIIYPLLILLLINSHFILKNYIRTSTPNIKGCKGSGKPYRSSKGLNSTMQNKMQFRMCSCPHISLVSLSCWMIPLSHHL